MDEHQLDEDRTSEYHALDLSNFRSNARRERYSEIPQIESARSTLRIVSLHCNSPCPQHPSNYGLQLVEKRRGAFWRTERACNSSRSKLRQAIFKQCWWLRQLLRCGGFALARAEPWADRPPCAQAARRRRRARQRQYRECWPASTEGNFPRETQLARPTASCVIALPNSPPPTWLVAPT